MNFKTFIKSFLAFALALITSTGVFAQSRTVSGKIVHQETGEPLRDVSVGVKGTATTVVSNAEGTFTIPVPSPQSVLVFSFVGLGTQEILVRNNSSLTVSMSAIAKTMDEVVVIGYGAVKRRDLTGAVSSIKAEEIVQTPTHNAIEAMQGRVSGVDITRSSGAAGAGSNILVRGTRSLSANNSPLYVIDGFQGGNISDLNPNDIESIDILKDASSTAIYGAQGANGVIIVTTKKGATGRMRVSYDGFYGVNGYTSFPKPRLREDYIQLRREAFRTGGVWASPADDPKLFPIADEWAAVQAGSG
jgi:TonB-dependent SusC/RagA subfamily outer membrane receptor